MKFKSPLSFITLTSLLVGTHGANAQTYTPSNRVPVADGTMKTQVAGSGNNFNITGGENRGGTLFHSFRDFSVPTGGEANFINPNGTRDIITRVTGNNFSDINGLINSNAANFFLINPNGVTFGTNAKLNVGKAFMATTAEGINLVDGGGRMITFGTNASGDALLSIALDVRFNISSLMMGGGNGQINNFGTLENVTPNQNQYIGLIGGNVNFNSGQIFAPGATVELGGLIQAGTVEFSIDRGVRLPENVSRGNVSLVKVETSPSIIDVRAGGGGNINIFASDIALLGTDSKISTGIGDGLGLPTAKAGDLKIDATGKISISEARISNDVANGAEGKGGNVEVATGNLTIINGGKLSASTFGKGDAGSVKITATGDISVDDGNRPTSGIFSTIGGDAVGNSGGIEINTRNLTVTNGAKVNTSLIGKGNTGSVRIVATGNISIDGIKSDVISTVGDNAVGNSGGIEITTNNLSVTNGARLTSSNGGQGNAGNVTITTSNLTVTNGAELMALTTGQGDAGNIKIVAIDNVNFDDSNSKNGFITGAFSSVEQGAVGKGGGIEITTRNLTVANGAQLSASTSGKGDAGNVKIIAIGDILFDGDGSGVFSTVEQGAVGKGGNIEITTRNLTATNAGGLNNSTYGQGDAGNVKITATGNISFDGSKNGFVSGIASIVDQGAVGKSGNIEINTGNIAITNSANITVSTSGQGDAGNIKIIAAGDVLFNGNESGVFSTVEQGAVGQGGNIDINTRNLTVNKDARVSTSSYGQGDAGKISIDAKDKISVTNQGQIISTVFPTAEGNSQGIKIDTGDLILINSSVVSSIVLDTTGDAGDIKIVSKGNLDISKNSFISSANLGEGQAGNISINTNQLSLNKSSVFTNGISASGGDLQIEIKDLLLLRNSSFLSTSSGSGEKNGNGGNITIGSPLIVATPGNNDITANAYQGAGGRVNITSQGLFDIKYRAKDKESKFTSDITSSSTFGQDGLVTVNTPGTDPGRDTTELPNNAIDATNQISQVCSLSTRTNKLTVTGRGGMPPTARDPLNSDVVWQDPRATNSQPVASTAPTDRLPPPAVGMVFDGKGKVTLIAAGTQGQQAGTKVVCPK